jgi:transcriptional/translational regulatory protein YebC/TACO1
MSGGKLGETGCVSWMFERKGMFLVPAAQIDEDALMELSLDVGADDVKRDGDMYEVTCDPSVFQRVSDALAARELKPETSQIARIPTSTVDLDAEAARNVLKLMERLDDHDDVQSVSANFNIPDEAMAAIEQ